MFWTHETTSENSCRISDLRLYPEVDGVGTTAGCGRSGFSRRLLCDNEELSFLTVNQAKPPKAQAQTPLLAESCANLGELLAHYKLVPGCLVRLLCLG